MEIRKFEVHSPIFVGDADNFKRFLNCVILLAAQDEDGLSAIVHDQIGVTANQSPNFEPPTEFDVMSAISKGHAGAKGYVPQVQADFAKLLAAVEKDLGSIRIINVIAELLPRGHVVERFRVTAAEGDRVRVIYYLPEKEPPLSVFSSTALIEAIEDKF